MRKISTRTAETIRRLSNKGPEYVEAIKALADKLRQGKVGHNKLSQLVEKGAPIQGQERQKIYGIGGQHMFTLRLGSHPSIHFPAKYHHYFKDEERVE